MSFADLPSNWPELPLTTPGLACDVVDLILGMRDRANNSLLVLPCDEKAVPFPSPIVFESMQWHCSALKRKERFALLSEIGVPGMLVALSCYATIPDDVALRWHRTASLVLPENGVRLVGLFTATRHGVHEVGGTGAHAA